jgi:RNA polymerase sigma-70 factor (ECF subfamily)
MQMQSDEQLAEAIQRGDQSALQLLVERYYDPILRYLYRTCGGVQLLAEDLTQETFVKMMRGISRFDPDRRFRPWLYAIATHSAVNYLSRAEQRRVVDHDDEWELAADQPEADSLLEAQEREKAVRAALAALPDHQRIVVVLYYYEEMPQADIAEMLAIPVGTVKSRLSLGLKRLREWIEKEEGRYE